MKITLIILSVKQTSFRSTNTHVVQDFETKETSNRHPSLCHPDEQMYIEL